MKRKLKLKITVGVIVLFLFVLPMSLIGCSKGNTTRFISDPDSETIPPNIKTYIMTDIKTGCKYVVFDWYQGGGVSPLLDRDGNVTCSK